jgi:hypothetical protein
MNPDQLAELEEERRFLLRSLSDLEREHAAGDVDDVDYAALKDGYTVRAAAAVRAIEEGREALPPKPAPNWKRRLIVGAGVVVAIGLVWWALAAWTAERAPGQQLSGLDPRDERQLLMSQARQVQFQSPGAAAAIYAQVLESDPEDVEALTYRGWTLALDAVQNGGVEPSGDASSADAPSDSPVVEQLRQAVELLVAATELDPSYPDPKCFLGIVNFRILGQAEIAEPWIEACLAANPPADVRDLVEPLRDEIAAAVDGTPPTTAP